MIPPLETYAKLLTDLMTRGAATWSLRPNVLMSVDYSKGLWTVTVPGFQVQCQPGALEDALEYVGADVNAAQRLLQEAVDVVAHEAVTAVGRIEDTLGAAAVEKHQRKARVEAVKGRLQVVPFPTKGGNQ